MIASNDRWATPLAAATLLLGSAGGAQAALAVSDALQIGAGTALDPVLYTGTLYENPNGVDLNAQGGPQPYLFYSHGSTSTSAVFDLGLVGLLEPLGTGQTGPRVLSDLVVHLHNPALPFTTIGAKDAWLMVSDADAGTFNANLSGVSALWNSCKSALGLGSTLVGVVDSALALMPAAGEFSTSALLLGFTANLKLSFLEETGNTQDMSLRLLSKQAVLARSDVEAVPLPASFPMFLPAMAFALTTLRRRTA